jgi:DNA topoisomerase I
VLNAYLDGGLVLTLKERVEDDLRGELSGLPPEEAAVLAFLQSRLAQQGAGTPERLAADA